MTNLHKTPNQEGDGDVTQAAINVVIGFVLLVIGAMTGFMIWAGVTIVEWVTSR